MYKERILKATSKREIINLCEELDLDTTISEKEKIALKELMLDKQILLTMREG